MPSLLAGALLAGEVRDHGSEDCTALDNPKDLGSARATHCSTLKEREQPWCTSGGLNACSQEACAASASTSNGRVHLSQLTSHRPQGTEAEDSKKRFREEEHEEASGEGGALGQRLRSEVVDGCFAHIGEVLRCADGVRSHSPDCCYCSSGGLVKKRCEMAWSVIRSWRVSHVNANALVRVKSQAILTLSIRTTSIQIPLACHGLTHNITSPQPSPSCQ